MARIYRIKVKNKNYTRLRDTASGRLVQYIVNLEKFTAKQWLAAHSSVMQALTPAERQSASNMQIRQLAQGWLNSPKEVKTDARAAGLKISHMLTNAEAKIDTVFESYLADFSQPGINSATAVERAKRHCRILLDFLRECKTKEYSKLQRETLAKYPEWRNANRRDRKASVASANTVNQELNRMAAVMRHGVKFHNWRERYLLDGIRVKPTQQNTKAIRPFEISEIKTIFAWLRDYSGKTNGWHLHDMALLALCTGLEAKALNLLQKDWFKPDLGILRVYDKLVHGIIDAKTQNRARDIPLTPTLRNLCERGFIFRRDTRTRHASKKGGTDFRCWAETILRKAESETGISQINLHRFRHTCATARLSAGWQLVRVSRMMGHSNVNTTASHYAEYDLSASPAGFEGMLRVYGEFVRWLDVGYFGK